jgi:[protein-PII] uridylyltransferase
VNGPAGALVLGDEALDQAAAVLAAGGDRFDWNRIAALLAAGGPPLARLRTVLACGNAGLRQRFLAAQPTGELLRDRARLVDAVIAAAWQATAAQRLPGAALVAVGGYGRGELHPASDVDLLVLIEERDAAAAADAVPGFITLLWDSGLEIRQSVRSTDQCRADARDDLTVVTTLMESRLILGPDALHRAMEAAIAPDAIWPDRAFFEGKIREQQARHHRYDDTAYNLEPDVKGSPGGLRDIHMIGWVARRHFGSGDLDALVRRQFLSGAELRQLQQGREFLWRIRFALHLLTGRHEDRLLFDHQARIAQLFGYQDASYMLAVEQFMQRYYRTVMDLSRLNEMVLQQFQEAILTPTATEPEPVNERFRVRHGFLEAAGDQVFEQNPSALLEVFWLLQQRPEVKGVSARTISLIQRSLPVIDDEFRQDPRNHRLFLQILRAKEGVTHELRRMNRYGVLGRYVPAFGRIVGRMQYDLFHAYTVDEHTLFVVSNLRRFALPRFDHEFPRCSELFRELPNPEIAYLAGMFHDIAKGRGGDHSELGAIDAEAFCLEHGLSRYDARLVAWLVRNHLMLSVTAQKRDISDPAVIAEFARRVGDETHLGYLYVLTVADVRGTNPKLWNSWKARLFEELYNLARLALQRGLENPVDKDELITGRKATARELLAGSGMAPAAIDRLWLALGDEYFLRYRPEEIAWHSRSLGSAPAGDDRALVGVDDSPGGAGTAIFVYSRSDQYNFATATAVLDELGLNIADARIVRLANGFSLSTYVVLDGAGLNGDHERRDQIRRRLEQALEAGEGYALRVTRRPPRQVRMFSTPTHVAFAADAVNGRTVMELVAGDRPGLLCQVGRVLKDHGVAVQAAKIVTVGERAEDVFYVTDAAGSPLATADCARLKAELARALDPAA